MKNLKLGNEKLINAITKGIKKENYNLNRCNKSAWQHSIVIYKNKKPQKISANQE